jgi:hypothetical protein
MQDIKQALCSAMYRFVSDKISELKPRDSFSSPWYGFKDKADMMNSIKTNWNDAAWALTELCHWGFEKMYYNSCFVVDNLSDDFETPIHCIVDDDGNKRYFRLEYSSDISNDELFDSIIEVNRTVKLVEQVVWEEQNG